MLDYLTWSNWSLMLFSFFNVFSSLSFILDSFCFCLHIHWSSLLQCACTYLCSLKLQWTSLQLSRALSAAPFSLVLTPQILPVCFLHLVIQWRCIWVLSALWPETIPREWVEAVVGLNSLFPLHSGIIYHRCLFSNIWKRF